MLQKLKVRLLAQNYNLLRISGQSFKTTLFSHVYENSWEAESEDQLRKRSRYCLRKVDKNLVQKYARTCIEKS